MDEDETKSLILNSYGGLEAKQHLHNCAVSGCPECAWARNYKRWQLRCPFDPLNVARGSWLVPCQSISNCDESVGGPACAGNVNSKPKLQFGVGCSVCIANGTQNNFGRGTVGHCRPGDDVDNRQLVLGQKFLHNWQGLKPPSIVKQHFLLVTHLPCGIVLLVC